MSVTVPAGGHEYIGLARDQLLRQSWQAVKVAFREARFDHHVLAIDKARLLQALTKRGDHGRRIDHAPAIEVSDDGQDRRLPGGGERRCQKRKGGDELAAMHHCNILGY